MAKYVRVILSVTLLLGLAVGAMAQPRLFEVDPIGFEHATPAAEIAIEAMAASPRSARVAPVRILLDALEAPSLAVVVPAHDDLVFDRERIERRSESDYTWFGRGDDPASHAILVVRNGRVTGTLRSGPRLYTITPLDDGLHVLTEVDEAAMEDHPPEWADFQETARAEAEAAGEPGWAGREARSEPVVMVLMIVTESSAAVTGDPEGLARLIIDETNYTYELSGIGHRVSLAHTHVTTSQETGSNDGGMITDIFRLRENNNGFVDEAHDLRHMYEADLVMLVGEYSDYCGVAFLWASQPSSGFSIVARGCAVGSYVAAHEIGHNMGAHHNPEVANNTHFPYGHGTTRLNGGWRTVMAYNNQSGCPGGFCYRIPFFSTPSISYHGLPLGDAPSRDNVRVHNETAAQISGYYGTQFGPAAIVTPHALDAAVDAGETTTLNLQISNTGEAPLQWWTMAGSSIPSGADGNRHLDDYGYAWTDVRFPEGPIFDFIDIGDADNAIPVDSFETACDDGPLRDGYAAIELPFHFPFYGIQHDSVRISVNGFITFDDFDDCASHAMPHPHPQRPHDLIAPLWMDMNLQGGGIYTKDLDDGRFVVQWEVRDRTTNRERVFQAVLFETGDIEFHYEKPSSFVAPGGGTIRNSVGARSPDGSTGLQVAWGGESRNLVHPGYAVHIRPPIDWLEVNPHAGALFMAENTTLTITIDASHLPEGLHEAEMQVRTNDPVQPVHRIPVTVLVGPVGGDAEAEQHYTGVRSAFPNPARSHVSVPFTLARSGDVTLRVYDLLGRHVATVHDEFLTEGAHEASWSVDGLPNGVYIVQLRTADELHSVRLTIAR